MFVDALVHVFICGFTSCSVFLTSFIYGLCIIRSFIYLLVTIHIYSQFIRAQTHTGTRTHLLRTVTANSVVECTLRAKTIPLNLTGGSLRGPEKQWKAAIAIASANWRKLEADPFQQSHIAPNLTDCENRTGTRQHQIEVQKFRLV